MLSPEVADRVKSALFAQKYNLLLGAGVSLDSNDRSNKPLLSAERLRAHLCALKGAKESSPLWRVTGLLTPIEVEEQLTQRYLGCRPGPTASALTRFAWRSAFTLNIDDVIENAYASTVNRFQSIVPVNFSREYETFRDPQELPLIHLHGSVRYPEDGYVFSLQEYAGLQRDLNAWVHALSGLIVSEPFIIAGTSLFEPDLEYFLAHRPTSSQVLTRAPSILVEPSPDAHTRHDCSRLNLVLVEAKLNEFLEWCIETFGEPPSPLELREPRVAPTFISPAPGHVSLIFWSEFDFVAPPQTTGRTPPLLPGAFHFGKSATWGDIANKLDVPLQDQLQLIDEIKRWQASTDSRYALCLRGLAGSGKSTSIRRVASDLAALGFQVFYVKATAAINVDAAIDFLSTVQDPIVLVTDSLAEHGEQLLDVAAGIDSTKRLCILGGERRYRMPLVEEILDGTPNSIAQVGRWRPEERLELIQRYINLGLVGNSEVIQNPRSFAKAIADDPVAESVCRILNDFRPLQTIVRSLWNDTDIDGRAAYLGASLAFYCHPAGIRRDHVMATWPSTLLADLEWSDAPLRLVSHQDDDEYLIPANATVSNLLLREMASRKPQRLFEVVVQLANSLAPFVTRHTIQQRTPEARLAGRLFDADGPTADLLGARFDDLYEKTYERWRWNSRYWEQRALRIQEKDRGLALQYARHAVSIELHPFPMTTLAHILFAAAAEQEPPNQQFFGEALDLMKAALRIEATWRRDRTKKGYWGVINGTDSFLQAQGRPTLQHKRYLEDLLGGVMRKYPSNDDIHSRAAKLLGALRLE